MSKKVNKKISGFTLIETLIYIAIIGGVIASFIAFSFSITGSRNKVHVIEEVQANARVALDVIAQKIRAADDILSPTEGNNASALILDMPSPDPDLTISVNGGVLGIAEGAGAATPITSTEVNISSISFTNLAPTGERENIRLEMTIDYNYSGGSVEYSYAKSYQTSVSLRQ